MAQENSYYTTEGIVPVDPLDFALQDYTDFDRYDPFSLGATSPLHKQQPGYHHQHHHPAHAAAVPIADGRVKPEPVSHDRGQFVFDYGPHATAAYNHHHQHHHWSQGLMAQYPPSSSQPLQISQPPTPGAECLVSSTISPLASPFTPQSEAGSFDDISAPLDTQPLDLGDARDLKGLTEEQLVSLSARDLNRLCRDFPEDLIKQLKKRRRTLKNRGYAYNSRVRRVTQKNSLEKERDALKNQLSQLTERVRLLQEEKNQWKRRAQALERGEEVWSPDK